MLNSDCRLSYLHTGHLMDGITQPILWKSSPSKTEIVILSKYNHGELSLREAYLESTSDSSYSQPSIVELSSIAIQIVQALENIHSKKVRHGALRPEVISFWVIEGEYRVCIRDFSESRLLEINGNPSTLSTTPPSSNVPGTSLCYQAPELSAGNSQPGRQYDFFINV
jgi:serine/threonine protein kinase